jgi:2-polyprenyl-3-methyl-5-hydroxy-6-metoxy-1,4-benzoquinol methylase
MTTSKTSAHRTTNLEKYQGTHSFAVARIGTFYDNLVRLIDLARPTRILSLGCGEGFDAKHIHEKASLRGARYCGLDLNPKALETAQEVLAGIPFAPIQGDIYHLPFKLNGFDVILCLEVLEHLEHPERILGELARQYKGYCFFSVPNEPFYRLTRMLVYKRDIRRLGDHPEHLNHWSKKGITRLIRKHFTVEQVVTPFPWTIIVGRSKGT